MSREPSQGSHDAPRRVSAWLAALEPRHTADLTFQEVSRALRALSSCYVERRSRIVDGSALEGAGKRAAFALFYAPLHFLLLQHIADALRLQTVRADVIVDLGCGTGAAGAALALAGVAAPVAGFDRSAWAVQEAEWTWRALGVAGRAHRADVARLRWPRGRALIVAAFTINELPAAVRDRVLDQILTRVERGDTLLVVEPLAGSAAPWWRHWHDALAPSGVEAHEWRVPATLPDIVARLDRAAGLDHRVLTGRSLLVRGAPTTRNAERGRRNAEVIRNGCGRMRNAELGRKWHSSVAPR